MGPSDSNGFKESEGLSYTKSWTFYKGPFSEDSEHADFSLYTGRANEKLSQEVAHFLGVPLKPLVVKSFTDGEVSINIKNSVRNQHVYICQPICRSAKNELSVNDALVELCLLVSAFRRHSAKSITVVIPYFGYARQDRTMNQRVPISAADVCIMLEAMGVERVISLDLHVGQIEGFFNKVGVDHISATPLGALYFSEKQLVNPVVVSPDAGGVARAKAFRKMLTSKPLSGIEESVQHSVGFAIIIKQRAEASKISSMDLVGNVDGCDCILADDMIDTAGTLCKAAALLKEMGARRVFAFATHGLFSGPAQQRLRESVIEEVVVTNSVPLPGDFKLDKVKRLSVAPLLAQVIRCLHNEESLKDTVQVN
mmetsp:Transcript_24551/g.30012  ORF Transcript_24551/g.30012 Transcript_24551/m.30012 type:complete len:368 (-) Transcript_24551:464-1567(-)